VFAIVEIGSRQFKVSKDDILSVPRVAKKKEISYSKVLFISEGADFKVGTPYIKNAKVVCDVICESKGPKVIAFKYRRRKNSRRIRGHRDLLSKVKVKEISKGE